MKRVVLVLLGALLIFGCGDRKPALDLWTAAATGQTGVIQQHVKSGTDMDAQEPAGGSSPLIVAALFGQTEAAKILVENGASLDFKNNDGSTALHTAAFFCHPETVDFLLKQGADTEIVNKYGQTPLDAVSAEWSSDLEGAYNMIGAMLKLDLDLERIREVRPQVAELIRGHAKR